jgi:hypothetical protein
LFVDAQKRKGRIVKLSLFRAPLRVMSHATGPKALSVLILVVAALSRLRCDEIDAGRADFERARPGVDGKELLRKLPSSR